MESIYERTGGTYHTEGDILIPDLEIGAGADYEIGHYGRLYQRYLEEHHPGTYASLVISGKQWEHLAEIDRTCNERMERLIPAMVQREGVTEALKATNQLEWVGRMNNIRNRAEEIVLSELIYSG